MSFMAASSLAYITELKRVQNQKQYKRELEVINKYHFSDK